MYFVGTLKTRPLMNSERWKDCCCLYTFYADERPSTRVLTFRGKVI